MPNIIRNHRSSALTLAAVTLLLAAGNVCPGQKKAQPSGPEVPTGNGARNDRLAWFREARFGMFIHWGPYSELAGEWKGQRVEVGRNAEWIMKFLKIPAAEYRELARQFNPVKFDAEAWVRLAQATGMRYLVVTAKHHDGFAMYHSKVSPYNIVDWTPFQRDPLREQGDCTISHFPTRTSSR
ncbi:MAG: hypothetical protein FJ280_25935 [Planctomycetes bacterium]|nr:hypothetical protein [Planctomycetota bacterium]